MRDYRFAGLVAASYAFLGFTPDAQTHPRMKWGLYVSGNFFRVLGVEPTVGRGFRPDEDQVEGRDPVVVLGHDFWVGQFAAKRSVVGSRIRLNGIEFRAIGVAPEHFTGIDNVFRPQLFVPLAMLPRMSQKNYLHDREFGWLFIKGRLKPGVGLAQAQADIAVLPAALDQLHSSTGPDQRLQVETEYQFRMAQGPMQMAMVGMLVLLGISVLLVACANVAGLLLSRARARAWEIAVRLAIGASRAALVRQLLLESLLVAVAGGVAALAVADAFNEFWRHVPVPADLPVVFEVKVDHRVLLVTMIVSVLSTLLFGLVPALRATRPNLVPALKAADADSVQAHATPRAWIHLPPYATSDARPVRRSRRVPEGALKMAAAIKWLRRSPAESPKTVPGESSPQHRESGSPSGSSGTRTKAASGRQRPRHSTSSP